MTTTEDLRRWAVETSIRAGSSHDWLTFAQRLVDFVASPGAEAPAAVPADFGKRANEAAGVTIASGMGQPLDWQTRRAPGEVSRDALTEREAVAGWLDAQGSPRLARAIRGGAHHE